MDWLIDWLKHPPEGPCWNSSFDWRRTVPSGCWRDWCKRIRVTSFLGPRSFGRGSVSRGWSRFMYICRWIWVLWIGVTGWCLLSTGYGIPRPISRLNMNRPDGLRLLTDLGVSILSLTLETDGGGTWPDGESNLIIHTCLLFLFLIIVHSHA